MRKHLSAIQENQVGSLNQEDPLEKGMATHSSILSWSISCTEEPGDYSRWVTKNRAQMSNYTFFHTLCLSMVLIGASLMPQQ